MTMYIHTNVSSLTAQRNLGQTNRSVGENIARLSSGFRINSARDDAAGLAISEGMRAGIRSLEQAGRNTNDAISLLQTAEGALGDISNLLVRARELAVQAASDGMNDDQRSLLEVEMEQLGEEFERIIAQTRFNGMNLLDGSFASGAVFMIGAEQPDTITFSISNIASTVGEAVSTFLSLETVSAALTTVESVDVMLTALNTERSKVGSVQNRLDLIVDNIRVQHENLSAANSRIREVDVASEMANFTKNQILMQAGTSMLSQANIQPQLALSLIR